MKLLTIKSREEILKGIKLNHDHPKFGYGLLLGSCGGTGKRGKFVSINRNRPPEIFTVETERGYERVIFEAELERIDVNANVWFYTFSEPKTEGNIFFIDTADQLNVDMDNPSTLDHFNRTKIHGSFNIPGGRIELIDYAYKFIHSPRALVYAEKLGDFSLVKAQLT